MVLDIDRTIQDFVTCTPGVRGSAGARAAGRARTLAKSGQRERLIPADPAPGRPFDNGRFDIVVESLGADDPGRAAGPAQLVQITRGPR